MSFLEDFWGTNRPVLIVDIDGTLCDEGRDLDDRNWLRYANAAPHLEEIEALRRLSKKEWFIVLWTARFEGDRGITQKWLADHGVSYDRLIMGKMVYSAFVDANARSSLVEIEQDEVLLRRDEHRGHQTSP